MAAPSAAEALTLYETFKSCNVGSSNLIAVSLPVTSIAISRVPTSAIIGSIGPVVSLIIPPLIVQVATPVPTKAATLKTPIKALPVFLIFYPSFYKTIMKKEKIASKSDFFIDIKI